MSPAAFPRYVCHKTVRAVKIAAIQISLDRRALIEPVDSGFGTIQTEIGWTDRFRATDGDLGYYVVYDDGYTSWSPSKAFEEGYVPV